MKNHIDFVFDESGRIASVEVTAESGAVVKVGKIVTRDDGTTALRITEDELEDAADATKV